MYFVFFCIFLYIKYIHLFKFKDTPSPIVARKFKTYQNFEERNEDYKLFTLNPNFN